MRTSVEFLRVEVHSDDEEYKKWKLEEGRKEGRKEGKDTLFDFASHKLNQILDSREYRDDILGIINIEHLFCESEVRPKQNNSSTWYNRYTLSLLVWCDKRKRGNALL